MDEYTRRIGFIPYFIFGVGLSLIGILAMNHIVNTFWPIDVERLDLVRSVSAGKASATQLLKAANLEIVLSFLAAVVVAITGISLPMVYYLNRRFRKFGDSSFLVILRQSMWVAFWVAFCLWLQMNRSVTWGVVLLVAGVFIILEVMLQVRTRAAHLAADSG